MSDVAADHQNGVEEAEKLQAPDGEAAASSPGGGSQGEPEVEEELWHKRLWFVRMPRPPEAGAIKVVEQEVDTYRTQLSLITEALNVKKVERDSAREATRAAREAFNLCRAAYDERAAPVKELQQERRAAADSSNKLKESFSDLLVRSEAELEEQLRGLDYRISHESITLNEEKKALATIKKLEQQRERVKEYEASASLFADSKAKRSELQEAVKEYEGELKALRAEMDMQRQILDKLREHEKGIDAEVEEIIGERRRCREVMEGAYQRMTALKKAQWERNNAFYTNRGFSRDVRKMVAEGRLEEARDACAEQQEEAQALLTSNPDFAKEYFALWDQQRKVPVMAGDDVTADLPPPSKGSGAKGAKGAGRKADEAPVDPAKKAEAAIAALLEEARGEARRAKAAATAAEAAERDASAASAAAAASVAAAERAQAAQAARGPVVGLEEVTVEGSKPHHAKPPRPAHVAPRAPVVEPVVVPPENFELPESAKALKEKTPSSQELKELERERQRAAREEADRRKSKREAEKEKKRQRLLAAAAKAQEAADAAQAAATAAVAAAAGSEADTVSTDGDGAGAGRSDAEVAPEQGGVEQRKKGGAKPAAKVAAAKPVAARRPPGAGKKAGAVQQLKRTWAEYDQLLMLGGIGLLLAVLLGLGWTAYTTPQ